MIIKKIANYNSGKSVDRKTSIKRVEGTTGFIFADGRYVGRTTNDVDLVKKEVRKLIGKIPKQLSVIWFRDYISPPVMEHGLDVEFENRIHCKMDYEFMYQFQVNYEEEKFDGDRIRRFFDVLMDLAKIDLDFDPSVGAEGDNGVIQIPDWIINNILCRVVSHQIVKTVRNHDWFTYSPEELEEQCRTMLNNDPLLLNYSVRIVDLKMDVSLFDKEMLDEIKRIPQESGLENEEEMD